MTGGVKRSFNLGVKVRGAPPSSLREEGDKEFEVSRAQAQIAFDRLQEDLKRKANTQGLLERIHEIKTGEKIVAMPLADMVARWKAIPRRKPPTERYAGMVESSIEKFTTFMKKAFPSVKDVGDVQASHAKAFMSSEEQRGVASKTYNNTLILFRSIFGALGEEAGSARNPFAGIPTKLEDTVHRKPFTAQELAAITEHAQRDDFIGPVILTGLSTAMRRGDCCLLKWESVDLKDRFVAVKTAKTGEIVRIPILPLLAAVLDTASKTREPGEKYVFPKQAIMYQANPDGITLRAKNLYAKAGFHDLEGGESPSLGTVSQERPKGLRKASVRDFHSLRVTWVTLALSAGVPIEIVQKVTGHQTAQIVLKHYFQPGKEDYRRTIETKLPALMGGTTAKELLSREKLAERLKAMNGKNWRVIRDELLAGL